MARWAENCMVSVRGQPGGGESLGVMQCKSTLVGPIGAVFRPRAAGRARLRWPGAVLAGALLMAGGISPAPPVLAAAPSASTAIVPRPKPPVPPRTSLMSNSELALFEKSLFAADRKQWSKALSLAAKIRNELPGSLIRWRYLQDRNSAASAEEIVQFIRTHPGWPRQSTLLRRAEQTLPDDMPARQVIAWFAGQEPLTGEGKVKLGEAYLAVGQNDYGAYWIRSAWIHDDLPSRLERDILRRHGRLLNAKDHAARVDRLLWYGRTTAARRLLSRLESADRAVATARLALMARSSPKKALAHVPRSRRQDPGLIYELVRYYRRAEKDAEALALLRDAPQTREAMVRPDKWWNERHLLLRRAIKDQRYRDAYELAAHHGLEAGAEFAEGELLAGWLALRFLHEAQTAEAHFGTLYDGVGYPISKSRARYWSGRAAETAGDLARAAQYYDEAARYPLTFYGQLAEERLTASQGPRHLPPHFSLASTTGEQIEHSELVQAVRLLALTEQEKTLRVFLLHLADQWEKPEKLAALADLMNELDRPHLAVRVAKKASLKHIFLPSRAYPVSAVDLSFIASAPGPEAALVLGLSRQESEFNPRAISPVGARGLMQLMPGTARLVARRQGLPYSRAKLLDDPAYNLRLGSAHLGELLSTFDGSYILTIAAYNAGAHRVRQWLKDYGDPRHRAVDAIDWIEKIPFSETRNYVQRVLENTQIYRVRIGSGAAMRLHADLGLSPPKESLLAYLPEEPGTETAKTRLAATASQALPSPPAAQTQAPARSPLPAPPETVAAHSPPAIPVPMPAPTARPAPASPAPPAAAAASLSAVKPVRADMLLGTAFLPRPKPAAPSEPAPAAQETAPPPRHPPASQPVVFTPAPAPQTAPPASSRSDEPTFLMAPVVEPGDVRSSDRVDVAASDTMSPSRPPGMEECKVFIPDTTGGGTCADLPPPPPAEEGLPPTP